MFFDLFSPHADVSHVGDTAHGDISDAGHFHVAHDSQATDGDADGFSDALESRYGADPFDVANHPQMSGSDSDGDGFSDTLETRFGTDAFDAALHPDAFWAHHVRLAPDVSVNFDGRLDVPSDSASAS